MNEHENPTQGYDVSAVKLADEVAEEVRQSVLEFITKFRKGSSSGNGIMTIDELERNWDILDTKTKETYVKAISKELSSINEKELIETKKANMQAKG